MTNGDWLKLCNNFDLHIPDHLINPLAVIVGVIKNTAKTKAVKTGINKNAMDSKWIKPKDIMLKICE